MLARTRQLERGTILNAALDNNGLKQCCQIDSKDQEFLQPIINRYQLSLRAFHRTIKVARTIADLGGSTTIERTHLAEAFSYRLLLKR